MGAAAAEGGEAEGVCLFAEDVEVTEEEFGDDDEEAGGAEALEGAEEFEGGEPAGDEECGEDGEVTADEEEEGLGEIAAEEGDGGEGEGKGEDVGGLGEDFGFGEGAEGESEQGEGAEGGEKEVGAGGDGGENGEVGEKEQEGAAGVEGHEGLLLAAGDEAGNENAEAEDGEEAGEAGSGFTQPVEIEEGPFVVGHEGGEGSRGGGDAALVLEVFEDIGGTGGEEDAGEENDDGEGEEGVAEGFGIGGGAAGEAFDGLPGGQGDGGFDEAGDGEQGKAEEPEAAGQDAAREGDLSEGEKGGEQDGEEGAEEEAERFIGQGAEGEPGGPDAEEGHVEDIGGEGEDATVLEQEGLEDEDGGHGDAGGPGADGGGEESAAEEVTAGTGADGEVDHLSGEDEGAEDAEKGETVGLCGGLSALGGDEDTEAAGEAESAEDGSREDAVRDMHGPDSTVTCQIMQALLLMAALMGADVLPEDRGAAGLRHVLKQLSTEGRVLYVTAHPDDEDPALLTYLSRGLGLDVTMLVLNRGEGGANVVSGDFFEALGVLRTGEMLKAAQHYGVKVKFTRAVDYGFSKNIGEALRQWKEEELMKDAIAIAREVKPQVIISRFNESARDGHGHHQTAGRVAKRLFAEAGEGDWQPLKLYTSNWREGEAVTLRINTGAYDAVLGRSYAQIGREGYRWHRSQGMAGSVPRPGPVWANLKLEGSRVGMADQEKDIWERVAPRPVEESIAAAVRAFDGGRPEACAPALAEAWKKAPGRRELIDKALALALGVEFEALVEPEQAVTGPMAMFRAAETLEVAQPGQKIGVRMVLHERGTEKVENVQYWVKGDVTIESPEASGVYPLTIGEKAKWTAAGWGRGSVREAMYQLKPGVKLGEPRPEAAVVARVIFEYRGATVTLERPFETSSVEARVGAQRQPLAVGPALSVKFESRYGMAPLGKGEYGVAVVIKNLTRQRQKGVVSLELPPGFVAVKGEQEFDLAKEKETARVEFTLRLPKEMTSQEYVIRAKANGVGASFEAITQPGLETLYWSEAAEHRLRAVDVKIRSGLRLGYVMGSGDEVPEGLRQLGAPVEMLSESALASGDLSRYSTILLGIRAYAAREDVKRYNARLLEYVKQGGVLVVQYQTQEYDRNFGPYAYTQGRGAEETSEEDAPVKVLEPGREVFRAPNRIEAEDFAGWVEQRGSKFFATWATEWMPLVETQDQGQAPQRGVWLEARHGKGLYVYCSMAWYRQLPYAVPGAARLVANLVSLGAADAEWRKR